MKMNNMYCGDICSPAKVQVTWTSFGVKVSKVMVNDCLASALIDKLHNESVSYSVKFL